jgi:hypothetical protein
MLEIADKAPAIGKIDVMRTCSGHRQGNGIALLMEGSGGMDDKTDVQRSQLGR